MRFIQTLLTSRTTYIVIAMFVIGGTQAITTFIPAAYSPYVEGVLGLLALYTHTSGKTKLKAELDATRGY